MQKPLISVGLRDNEGFGPLQGGDTKYAKRPQGLWLPALMAPLPSPWPWAGKSPAVKAAVGEDLNEFPLYYYTTIPLYYYTILFPYTPILLLDSQLEAIWVWWKKMD